MQYTLAFAALAAIGQAAYAPPAYGGAPISEIGMPSSPRLLLDLATILTMHHRRRPASGSHRCGSALLRRPLPCCCHHLPSRPRLPGSRRSPDCD